MSRLDSNVKYHIENIINQGNEKELSTFFHVLSDKNIRRALYIFSSIFPNKLSISNREFSFIRYVLSDVRLLSVDSISDFIRAITIIDFSDEQKEQVLLWVVWQIHYLLHCDVELNMLIYRLGHSELLLNKLIEWHQPFDEPLKKYLINLIIDEPEYFLDEERSVCLGMIGNHHY